MGPIFLTLPQTNKTCKIIFAIFTCICSAMRVPRYTFFHSLPDFFDMYLGSIHNVNGETVNMQVLVHFRHYRLATIAYGQHGIFFKLLHALPDIVAQLSTTPRTHPIEWSLSEGLPGRDLRVPCEIQV